HVASGVDAHRLGIDYVLRIADPRAAIPFHTHLGRVSHLQGIAADGIEAILREDTPRVTGRSVEGVRPDPVAPNVAQLAAGDTEIAGPLFQQNAAGRIIAPRPIARPA